MSSTPLWVAHYGHPLLRGARHWSFLVPIGNGCAIEYQISGSSTTYVFKVEEIEVANLQSYMGKVVVGSIDDARRGDMLEILKEVPIIRGDTNWCCHHWIIEGLHALKNEGFEVDTPSREELVAKLAWADKD